MHSVLQLVRSRRREKDGFFLRAESYFNVATQIEELDREPGGRKLIESYGGVSLHEQSHGESFLALAVNRLGGQGFYLFDEPEAALSPTRQLSLLKVIDVLARKKQSQLIIATHSPILLAYPHATIYALDANGIVAVPYESTEAYQLTRGFMLDRQRYLKHLFDDTEDD